VALLSAAQLSQMRAQQTASLDQTCTLRTPAGEVSDDAGGTTPSGSVTDASVACRLGIPNGQEREIAARLGRDITATITFPHGTAVATTQQIVVGGNTYEVVDVNDDSSYKTATRVGVRRLS
jgi:SPP1 family predicted phage head-tail adaptor